MAFAVKTFSAAGLVLLTLCSLSTASAVRDDDTVAEYWPFEAVFGDSSTSTPSPETEEPNYCSGKQPSPENWDQCKTAGTFISKSYCYLIPGSDGKYVYRYDYYTCVYNSAGGIWMMYRRNCTDSIEPYVGPDGEIINLFNPETGKCDPPPSSST